MTALMLGGFLAVEFFSLGVITTIVAVNHRANRRARRRLSAFRQVNRGGQR